MGPGLSVLYCDISRKQYIASFGNTRKYRDTFWYRDIFLCMILANFGLSWTCKQLQFINQVVYLHLWASIGFSLLLYLICDGLTPYFTLKVGQFFLQKSINFVIFVAKTQNTAFLLQNLNMNAPRTTFGGNYTFFWPI